MLQDGSSTCPATHKCVERDNPGVGLQHWDNIGMAILTQFELITLEGWSDVMYKTRNAHGGSPAYDLFFYLSVTFGSFFVLNLMIAVQFNFLDEAFSEIEESKRKEKEKHDEEMQENRKNVLAIEMENQKEEQEEGKEIDPPPNHNEELDVPP